jgi:hypothetical protein
MQGSQMIYAIFVTIVVYPRPLLFTPPHPQLGHYEVFTTSEPLPRAMEEEKQTEPEATSWNVESAAPLDAFGSAGDYDRAALARLFGGRPASVARGTIQQDGRFVALTLISPYPDPDMRRLNPGTLIIRFTICCT